MARRPRHARTIEDVNHYPLWSPHDVADRFVEALGSGDFEIAAQLLAKDVVYTRTSRRPLIGRGAVIRHLQKFERSRAVLETVLLSAADDEGVAISERLTVLSYGPLRVRFWVCARFEVRGGRIHAWRDYVDLLDVLRAVGRAVAGGVAAPTRTWRRHAAISGTHGATGGFYRL